MRHDNAAAMMTPGRWAANVVKRADPTKAIVRLIAASVPASAVPAVGVIAIAAGRIELNCLHRR
jgi:hypothetical protein